MLPKAKRISRQMFPLLANGAKVLKNKLFLMRFVTLNQPESRFSFSVSKKVSKSAVIRNKLRRAGYRLLKDHILSIKSKVLVQFSFLRVPKDDQEIDLNLDNILKESKIK